MMDIFIDTGPLRGLGDPLDQWHTQSNNISQRYLSSGTRLITTDYVLSEVFTGLLRERKASHYRIKEFDRDFLKEGVLQIIWMTKERFQQTKTLFLKVSKDKTWSFTDCASFVVMKELRIKTAFTFDDHFEQMGFSMLK